MKQNILLTISAFMLLFAFSCSSEKKEEENNNGQPPAVDTTAQTQVAPAPEETSAPPDSAAMAKAWESYMAPGDMHKWMASTDGKWDAELTFWHAPDAPASPANKAKVENKTILGGRYQETTYKGKMDGMDFEGRGTMAFDNAKKKFISTWIDNMGTGLMVMEGTYDEGTKTINLKGTAVDAMTGKDLEMREVVRIIDDKNQVMEMYSTQNGKEFKTMEIKLAKK